MIRAMRKVQSRGAPCARVNAQISSADRVTQLAKFGAQSKPDAVLVRRAYRCVRSSGVPLLGLTDQRLDYLDTQKLGACQVFGEVPEPDLHLFGPVRRHC